MYFDQPINFTRLATRWHKITECVKLHVWFNICLSNLTIEFFSEIIGCILPSLIVISVNFYFILNEIIKFSIIIIYNRYTITFAKFTQLNTFIIFFI